MHRTIVCQESELPDELLYGRAGYLYALLYLNTEIGPGTVGETAIKEVLWAYWTFWHSKLLACSYIITQPLLLGGSNSLQASHKLFFVFVFFVFCFLLFLETGMYLLKGLLKKSMNFIVKLCSTSKPQDEMTVIWCAYSFILFP
jgi:hypothetical protein